MMFFTAESFKEEALNISQYMSNSTANSINSTYFLNQMQISDLKDFNPESPMAKKWIDSLKPPAKDVNTENNFKIETADFTFNFSSDNAIFTEIEINGKTIHASKNNNGDNYFGLVEKNKHGTSLFKKALQYFKADSISPLYDSKGNRIGSVTVQVNAGYPLLMELGIIILVIFIGIVLLIVINLISKLLVMPVLAPLKQLDENLRSIATGDHEGPIDSQITLKKPLKEIESLASSTNLIIQKSKEYNDLLAKQKVVLENQNEELEAQNEELIESKKQIEEAQTLLVQSQNMASIGQLTAAITHEINTPLGAINSNVQMYEMLLNSLSECATVNGDEASELLSQMRESNNINILACKRVSEIIKSLKNFTRIDQAEFQEVDVNEGIKSALILTSNLWKKKITLHEDYGSISRIKCYPGLLNQVFMNVIVNAIQSIEDKGEIFIKTTQESNNVDISIRDTGSGIKEENLSKIFDYGFSTKSIGTGAGLGLSICRNIINKHYGEIKVNSKLGEGTEFIITLPIENPKT
ncbi:MAG TPA: HAMP domain-containing sensor histidine kinase [Clostridia bacterium]|nr:HAMP domain-containing sensor histidine kinase [Clostridia bacterium]